LDGKPARRAARRRLHRRPARCGARRLGPAGPTSAQRAAGALPPTPRKP
jgi:hypothetical protein